MAMFTIRNTLTGESAKVAEFIGYSTDWILVEATTVEDPDLGYDPVRMTYVDQKRLAPSRNGKQFINLPYPAQRSGVFELEVIDANLTDPVSVQNQAFNDEAEFDVITVAARIKSATAITCYWQSDGPVGGLYLFNYRIGA
jgi:hypothetical protein